MNIHRTCCTIAAIGAALSAACTAAAGTMAPIDSQQVGISLVGPVAAGEQTSHHEYIQKNEGWFTQWTRKVDRFNHEAARKGAHFKRSAQKNLDAAWDDVKQRWADLKQVSSEGWQKAKDAYEKSQRKLERAWHDATS